MKRKTESRQPRQLDVAMKRAEDLGRSGASYTDVWKAIKEMKE